MIKLSWTVISGGIFLMLAGFFFYHTFDEVYSVSIATAGRGPVFFPRILLGIMLLLAFAVIWEGRHQVRTSIFRNELLPVLAGILLTGIYIYSISAAGFLISTTVFVFILPWLMGYRNLKLIVAITAIYPIAVWYIFDKVFKIILPTSPWFDAL